MAAARTRHPVRLALLCAMLALAGGAAGARATYAEVSAAATAAVRAGARAHDADVAAARHAATPSAAPIVVARTSSHPIPPRFVIAPLYLAHCSLLL